MYKLSFANSAMTAAHEASVAREPIGVAEKRQQLTYEKTLIFEY